jgi:hypothetical protein
MKNTAICLGLVWLLSGCNGAATTPTVIGSAGQTGGTYTITFDGMDYTLPAAQQSTDATTGEDQWLGAGYAIVSYESDNALALAGTVNGDPVAGITGTPNGTAVGGASYTTNYQIGTPTGSILSSTVTLTIDIDAETITGNNGASFVVNGDLSGADIGGSVDWQYFNGTSVVTETATLEGGLFGTDELAGVFHGDNYAGVLFGEK